MRELWQRRLLWLIGDTIKCIFRMCKQSIIFENYILYYKNYYMVNFKKQVIIGDIKVAGSSHSVQVKSIWLGETFAVTCKSWLTTLKSQKSTFSQMSEFCKFSNKILEEVQLALMLLFPAVMQENTVKELQEATHLPSLITQCLWSEEISQLCLLSPSISCWGCPRTASSFQEHLEMDNRCWVVRNLHILWANKDVQVSWLICLCTLPIMCRDWMQN